MKQKGIYALFILSVISLFSYGCNKNDQVSGTVEPPKRSFVIYSQIHYNHTPSDLSGYGISASVIHYPGNFLDTIAGDPSRKGNSNLDCKVINSSKLATLAQADANRDPKVPIILDIEAWSFAAQDLPATIDSFKKVINLYRSYNPNSPLGFYGNFPQTRWTWNNISTPDKYQNWQKTNDRMAEIVPMVQFFAPDNYVYGSTIDKATWGQYVQANLSEIKRYKSSNPAYAFICPQAIGGNFLSYDDWKFVLSTLYNLGYDGVFIWTSNRDSAGNGMEFTIASQLDWWKATLDFIKEKNITAR
ncbi:MAG: hypothetical protein JO154_21905 [Chitinophaga sp.]|uniref:hypothetical protein n=1 Tax=Chitinophaga sp. TaxID=1869181 RepID=UPI0025C41FA9|nr:hypothetical protein [Chitinophaga sp.]MBV8255270.1 hypothetical protein [Chitinophaga sp.]